MNKVVLRSRAFFPARAVTLLEGDTYVIGSEGEKMKENGLFLAIETPLDFFVEDVRGGLNPVSRLLGLKKEVAVLRFSYVSGSTHAHKLYRGDTITMDGSDLNKSCNARYQGVICPVKITLERVEVE